jgi:glycosyltransferase involved in cell wall biosynthesis
VSRLVVWKNVDRVINAIPTVLEEYPDSLLVIVGAGDERVKLEQLAKDLKVDDHTLFIGSIPHQEVQYYLAAADIFLSLYTWSNVGNPLLEAMLAGKCIVTLANGDTPRIIKHNVTGVLLEEDNLSPLPGILISLLRDPITTAALGENARRYALENLPTWEQRLSREINEVSQLLPLFDKSRCTE